MAKMSQNPYVFLNVFFWEYFKRSYWTLPQRLCILMNIYRLFKFSTLGSVSLHVTPQQIISNASSLYMTQLLAGEEPNNFQQFSTIFSWTKNHFLPLNLISLLLQIKSSTNRQVHAQSHLFKTSINLAFCSSWICFECNVNLQLKCFHLTCCLLG